MVDLYSYHALPFANQAFFVAGGCLIKGGLFFADYLLLWTSFLTPHSASNAWASCPHFSIDNAETPEEI